MNATRRTSRATRPLAALAALVILALSSVLFSNPLAYYRLALDDFPYAVESRTWPRLLSHLWEPHNAHVVPLFRLWTRVLMSISGDLATLPTVLAGASFAALALVMLAGGHLVAKETGRPALGLAAMAGLGLTTVMGPSATWYSAGQALWSGLATLAALLALQGWRLSGGAWKLGLAALAAIAAPAFWSGGYVAGLAGAAYLWADGRPRCRKAAAVPLSATMVYLVLILIFLSRRIFAAANFHDRTATQAAHPLRGLLHTAQAVPEVLVLGNLGLDTETTALQGVVFSLALLGLWAWSRRPRLRPNRLESAGMVMVVLGFAMVYTFRGYLPWDSVRSLGWYHAVPQIGAALFAAGWVSGRTDETMEARGLIDPRATGGVLLLAVVLFLVHRERAQRQWIAAAPPLTATERARFPTFELQRLRANYLVEEEAQRQRRFLARLGRAEQVARRAGFSRADVRAAFGRVDAPGWPPQVREYDALDLLDLPDDSRQVGADSIRAALGDLLTPEAMTRPEWIGRDEEWPPPAPPK